MSKYSYIISDANIAITNILIDNLNIGSNLKSNQCIKIINENLPYLKENVKTGLLNKFKNIMFEDSDDMIEVAKKVIDATEQLNICNICKCKGCVMNDEHCKCSGCLLGAYVSDCEGGSGIEVREVCNRSIILEDSPVVRLTHDRSTGDNIITTLNNIDKENKYKYNFSTGEYKPL